MLELQAGSFVEAAARLTGTASYIAGSTSAVSKEAKKSKAPRLLNLFKEKGPLEDEDRKFLNGRLVSLAPHLDILGADVTSLCVKDAETEIYKKAATWGNAKDAFDAIRSTLKRELSLKTVLVLQSEELKFYAPKTPLFGADFAAKFNTDGSFELEEAAKCYALGRPTAAVFHLMRILEIGIGAISACLEIPDPVKPAERNWAIILKKIKEEGIEKKWPTAASRMGGDGILFESLHASLDAVKNPWRNETMHVTGKYTDDEAKHIFVAVEGFMKKLSTRMDEKGQPLA